MNNPGQRKAKRSARVGTRAKNTMAKAQAIYARGAENLKSQSPMAQDKGMQQQLRAERLGKRAKRQKARSERLASESSLYKKGGGLVRKTTTSKAKKMKNGGRTKKK